jgi:hypothetical protein
MFRPMDNPCHGSTNDQASQRQHTIWRPGNTCVIHQDDKVATYRFFQNALSLFDLISCTLFMASSVVATSSRSYLTGTFLRFSNSNVESYVCQQELYSTQTGLHDWARPRANQLSSPRQRPTHNDHLLAVCPPERFRPSDLSRVPLHLEVFVTFRGAKPKRLGIVPDKHGAVSGVDVARAKVAFLDTHGGWW